LVLAEAEKAFCMIRWLKPTAMITLRVSLRTECGNPRFCRLICTVRVLAEAEKAFCIYPLAKANGNDKKLLDSIPHQASQIL